MRINSAYMKREIRLEIIPFFPVMQYKETTQSFPLQACVATAQRALDQCCNTGHLFLENFFDHLGLGPGMIDVGAVSFLATTKLISTSGNF